MVSASPPALPPWPHSMPFPHLLSNGKSIHPLATSGLPPPEITQWWRTFCGLGTIPFAYVTFHFQDNSTVQMMKVKSTGSVSCLNNSHMLERKNRPWHQATHSWASMILGMLMFLAKSHFSPPGHSLRVSMQTGHHTQKTASIPPPLGWMTGHCFCTNYNCILSRLLRLLIDCRIVQSRKNSLP